MLNFPATYTGPTSASADPLTPGAWQGSHWSANFEVTGMTRPRKRRKGKERVKVSGWERKTDRETDGQTDRHRDRRTDRQTDRQRNRHTEIAVEKT